MLIYLASPYSHKSDAVRESRYFAVCAACAALMRAGVLAISPIAHSHAIAERYSLPTGFEFWRELDHALIDACSEVWVLCLDAWDESVGVRDEIAYALERGMTVRYLDECDPTQPARERRCGNCMHDIVPGEPACVACDDSYNGFAARKVTP